VKRHLILVGLPGAGKTTIGRLVAAELRAPFVDLDVAIEQRAGKPIARLFAEDGEDAFRTLERSEMESVLSAPESVIAAGGGWAAQPGNLEAATGRALTVYLQVTPEGAAARVAPAADRRPLLAGADLTGRLRELLSAPELLPAVRRDRTGGPRARGRGPGGGRACAIIGRVVLIRALVVSWPLAGPIIATCSGTAGYDGGSGPGRYAGNRSGSKTVGMLSRR